MDHRGARDAVAQRDAIGCERSRAAKKRSGFGDILETAILGQRKSQIAHELIKTRGRDFRRKRARRKLLL